MKDMTAEMAKKTSQTGDKAGKLSKEQPALDRCYGQIGISAVAAAARYQGGCKNLAYAPVATRWIERPSDAA
jgi:hypothetical protein